LVLGRGSPDRVDSRRRTSKGRKKGKACLSALESADEWPHFSHVHGRVDAMSSAHSRHSSALAQVAARYGVGRGHTSGLRPTPASRESTPQLASRHGWSARDVWARRPPPPAGAVRHPPRIREATWDAEDPAPVPPWECAGPWEPKDAWHSSASWHTSYAPLSQEPDAERLLAEDLPRTVSTDWRDHAESFLSSVWFQAAIACLIVANAVVIGIETDSKDFEVWDQVEDKFLFVFASELVLKLIVYRMSFFDFNSGDFWWNSFDFLIVSLGSLDFIVGTLGSSAHPVQSNSSGGGVATVFRIIRLLRILRIFRIVKFLKQLYMLAFGFALAAVAVSWVTFLMFFVLYVCSIVLVRTVGHAPDDDPNAELLHRKFGSIIVAMFTLFEIMASPTLEDYEDIIWDRPCMAVFIIAFIIFGSFGMIALLTGVISESMFDKNNLRMEEERMERENTRKLLVLTCEKLFDQLPSQDQDKPRSDGAYTWEVLGLLPQIATLFESEGIDYASEDLFCILDVMDSTGSGTITRDEFKFCIVQMAEGVRPLLIMRIYYAMDSVRKQTTECTNMLQGLLSRPSLQDAERTATDRHTQVLRAISDLSHRMDAIATTVGNLTTSTAEASQQMVSVASEVATLRDTYGTVFNSVAPSTGAPGAHSQDATEAIRHTVNDVSTHHSPRNGASGLLGKVRRGMGVNG